MPSVVESDMRMAQVPNTGSVYKVRRAGRRSLGSARTRDRFVSPVFAHPVVTFETLTVTLAVAELPAASRATALIVWVPLSADALFQVVV